MELLVVAEERGRRERKLFHRSIFLMNSLLTEGCDTCMFHKLVQVG